MLVEPLERAVILIGSTREQTSRNRQVACEIGPVRWLIRAIRNQYVTVVHSQGSYQSDMRPLCLDLQTQWLLRAPWMEAPKSCNPINLTEQTITFEGLYPLLLIGKRHCRLDQGRDNRVLSHPE